MTNQSQATERRVLHFDLSGHDMNESYTIRGGKLRAQLVTHTVESLAAHREVNFALRIMPDERITHYAELDLPLKRALMLHVVRPPQPGEILEHPVALSFHIPKTEQCKAMERHGYAASSAMIAGRIQRQKDAQPAVVFSALPEVDMNHPQVHADMVDYVDSAHTAHALIITHPELNNIQPGAAADIKQNVTSSTGFEVLSYHIDQSNGKWTAPQVNPVQKTDKNGKSAPVLYPTTHKNGDPMVYKDSKGNPVNLGGTPLFYQQLTPEVSIAMKHPVKSSLQNTKNYTSLKGQCWTVQDGTTARKYLKKPAAVESMFEETEVESVGWSLQNITPQFGLQVSVSEYPSMANGNIIKLLATNNCRRHLSVYAQFLNDKGEPIAPIDWGTSRLGFLAKDFEKSDFKRYLDYVGPVGTIMGIPLKADGKIIEIPWKDDYHGAQILFGGLGMGENDTVVCPIGMIMTSVCEIGITTVLMVAGAVSPEEEAGGELLDKVVDAVLKELKEMSPEVSLSILFDPAGDPKALIETLGEALGNLLMSVLEAAPEVLFEIALEEILDEIPFVGWALRAIDMAADLADLLETTVEVLCSPKLMASEITRSMDIEVKLSPDNEIHYFPKSVDHYMLSVQYTGKDATFASYTYPFPAGKVNVEILDPALLKNLPAGGMMKISVFFFTVNDWIAGQGDSGWIQAIPASGTSNLNVTINTTNNLVPLRIDTKYNYSGKLICKDNKYTWDPDIQHQPVATAGVPDGSTNEGHTLGALTAITLNQQSASLGYVWSASGLNLPADNTTGPAKQDDLNTMQNISILQDSQQSFKSAPLGYSGQAMMAYDLYGPANGNHFYVDPRGGKYNLRKVSLDGQLNFDPSQQKSWGQFAGPFDDMAVHPAGFVVGVNSKNSKMEIMQLPQQACDDALAPNALILSGQGEREGLMNSPICVCVSIDGRILVLESINNRVQAFDTKANPVSCFAGSLSSFALKNPPSGIVYLGMGVESKGYIYVLYYLKPGKLASQYFLDIYNPDGTFLCQTQDFCAGRMTVSIDRTVYTLNYETFINGFGGRTEPSVSVWLPSTPATGVEN